jgi:hypothetical protein
MTPPLFSTDDAEIPLPGKSREFIESECLRVARLQSDCGHLAAVAIARTEPLGSGLNWEVLGFNPELPPATRAEAIKAIDDIRRQYVLAPYVAKPPRGRRDTV